MNLDLYEKKINRKEVFNGNIINVFVDDILLPNGKHSKREVVTHPGGVCVAAITENKELIFVKQHRYPYNKIILELPAGKLEKKQTPLENGIRELREETGAIGYDYVSLGELYPTPGYCSEIIYLYLCKVNKIINPSPDSDEFLKIEYINIEDAINMVLNNKIEDSKTQVVILKIYLLIQKGLLKL